MRRVKRQNGAAELQRLQSLFGVGCVLGTLLAIRAGDTLWLLGNAAGWLRPSVSYWRRLLRTMRFPLSIRLSAGRSGPTVLLMLRGLTISACVTLCWIRTGFQGLLLALLSLLFGSLAPLPLLFLLALCPPRRDRRAADCLLLLLFSALLAGAETWIMPELFGLVSLL